MSVKVGDWVKYQAKRFLSAGIAEVVRIEHEGHEIVGTGYRLDNDWCVYIADIIEVRPPVEAPSEEG